MVSIKWGKSKQPERRGPPPGSRELEMLSLIEADEKFALIAMRTANNLPGAPIELIPGLWASSAPLIPMGSHWREWLGSIRIEQIERCNLFLAVKSPSQNPHILDQENLDLENVIWKYYVGMLLAARFVTDGKPLLATGARRDLEFQIRQTFDLDRPAHPSADLLHRLSIQEMCRGAEIGREIHEFFQALPPSGAWRLNRILSLYTTSRSILEIVDQIHQYTRCLEGLTVPPIRGTRKVFAERCTLFGGQPNRGIFEDIYGVRGEIEHLHEYRYLEIFNRSVRLNLLIKAGIAEYVARCSLSRIFDQPRLWPHFWTTPTIEAFWQLDSSERLRLWGPPVNPLDGMAGFDETLISNTDLGGP